MNVPRLVLSITLLWFAPAIISDVKSGPVSMNGFDLTDATIPVREIVDGGPGRNGIPAINRPRLIAAGNAVFLDPTDRVLGVSVNHVHRAYPIRILNYHEIVNDVIDDVPVVITYCPLCGSGMAFLGEINDRRLIFGVSGLLYNNDVLLYDLQTESLWSQIKSAAVTGPMTGTRLETIPLAHTTWRDWLARHPDSTVLSTETGFRRDYEKDPYPDYRDSAQLYFPVAAKSRKYPQKSMVMGLELNESYKAYPFDVLERGPAEFTDRFAGKDLRVRYDDENKTAKILTSDGTELPTLIAFWFAWYAFHPGTEIYTAEKIGKN
jgi:hypothetical protein